MHPPRLSELFASLEAPTRPGTLSAARVPSAPSYRVARDLSGDGFVMLELRPNDRTAEARQLRLRHFEYEPTMSATIRMADTGSVDTRDFLVLRCRDGEADLLAHFFHLAEGLIDYLGENPTHTEADHAVRDLVELFRAMSGQSRRTIMGLWSELLVIVDSRDPAFAAASWHADPGEQLDFVSGNQRVEIKATTRAVREHDLALDQLVLPVGGVGLVVSFMLERSDVGVSANELLEMAGNRLPTRSLARRRLQEIVATTIGEDWRESDGTRFDLARARASRRIYDVLSIPSVHPSLPPQVSRVRFIADLSDTTPVSAATAAARGELPRALFDDGDLVLEREPGEA
ncbi:MAG TPA: PD-(D/E)XK motif protein [Polyangiaceae bacterium]|nr:PD-(D/E)XK motif protein [Polyangiaceae bacterium]